MACDVPKGTPAAASTTNLTICKSQAGDSSLDWLIDFLAILANCGAGGGLGEGGAKT